MPISHDDPIHALRRQLAAEITRSLGADSQWVIARTYGIPQPRMSELSRGVVDRCTVEWLIRRIHRLGGSVSVTVTLGDAKREWYRQRFARNRAKNAARLHQIGGERTESGGERHSKTGMRVED